VRIYGAFPGQEQLFTGNGWWVVGGIFVAFRLFDIVKPWPVRGSQALPGGWGITVDDFLAAAYVNLVTLAALAAGRLFQ
jgi:phosphatidylglycerophosphatase A